MYLSWSQVELNSPPLTDNTLYLSFIKSFVVAPFKTEQLIPLSMNIGVIGHETAHRVFNFKALSDEGIHPALGAWSLDAFNLLKSLDEGVVPAKIRMLTFLAVDRTNFCRY